MIQLASLQKDEAVMIVATEDATGVNAIKLLAGVEPLLEAPQAQDLLSSWSLTRVTPRQANNSIRFFSFLSRPSEGILHSKSHCLIAFFFASALHLAGSARTGASSPPSSAPAPLRCNARRPHRLPPTRRSCTAL